jgi:inhibitor of cysteine peptidase
MHPQTTTITIPSPLKPSTLLTTGAVVALLAIAAIALTQMEETPAVSASVGPDEAGSAIALEIGGELTIALPANPSTGYGWTVSAIDPAVVIQKGEPEFAAQSNLTGAGGTMTFRFIAAGAGESELRLEYRRPWEDAEPFDTFQVTVNVK